MRGTISECLSSVQRCSMSPLLFLKAKNLSEPYSLGCNADRRAAFSLSLSLLLPHNSHSSQLKWLGGNCECPCCVKKKMCLSVQRCVVCVSTWAREWWNMYDNMAALYVLCKSKCTHGVCMCLQHRSDGEGEKGEILLNWTLEQNQEPQK